MRSNMTTTWPRTLTDVERKAILSDQIERFAWDGWRVLVHSETSAQLTRRKRFSVVAAIFWTLVLLVGLVIYLLIYLGRRDPVVRLIVTEGGKVQGDFSDGSDAWPKLPGDWACRVCQYPNSRQHVDCRRCGGPR
jgi:hypothetical protein